VVSPSATWNPNLQHAHLLTKVLLCLVLLFMEDEHVGYEDDANDLEDIFLSGTYFFRSQ